MNDSNKELKKAGLKVTLPRLRVLELFENSEQRHLSAEDVYRMLLSQGEDVSLPTVYRVLTQFEQAQILVRQQFEGGPSVFELAAEEHHDHMVCVETGKVIEFYDEEIENLQHAIASSHGYEIVDHSLVLHVRPKKTPA